MNWIYSSIFQLPSLFQFRAYASTITSVIIDSNAANFNKLVNWNFKEKIYSIPIRSFTYCRYKYKKFCMIIFLVYCSYLANTELMVSVGDKWWGWDNIYWTVCIGFHITWNQCLVIRSHYHWLLLILILWIQENLCARYIMFLTYSMHETDDIS